MLGKYFAHSDASQQVRAEQIRAVAGHMPIVALGTVIAAGVVWFLLHDIVQRDHLDAWAAAIAVLLVVRMFYYRRFSQDAADDHAVLRRGRVLVARSVDPGQASSRWPSRKSCSNSAGETGRENRYPCP